MTVTDGGVSSGYRAMGSVGIAIAPASMIISEQTVARIGRRMKRSVNTTRAPGAAAGRAAPRAGIGVTGAPSPIFCMPRDDQLVAGLQAADNDVVVADRLPERHRALARHGALRALVGDEREVLAVDARGGHDRHREAGRRCRTRSARARTGRCGTGRRSAASGVLTSTVCVVSSTDGAMKVICSVASIGSPVVAEAATGRPSLSLGACCTGTPT